MWLFFYTKYFLSITEGLPCFLSSPATALFGSMLPASDTPRFSPSFPQSLNLPSNSPSHASCSQPPTLLSISFSAAKHVAHITTPWFLGSTYLGWEKMYNMCCHISTQTPLLSFNAILRCLSSPDCQKNFRPRGRSCRSWNLSLWQSQLKSWLGLSGASTARDRGSVGPARMSNRLQTYPTSTYFEKAMRHETFSVIC